MTNKTQRAMLKLGMRYVPEDKLDAYLDEVAKAGRKTPERSAQAAGLQKLSALPVKSVFSKEDVKAMDNGIAVFSEAVFIRIEGYKSRNNGLPFEELQLAQRRIYEGLVEEDGWIANPQGKLVISIHKDVVDVLEQKGVLPPITA